MADKIDSGPIVAQEKVVVKPDDTSPDLLNRCFAAGAELLIKVLPDYLSNKITLTPQPDKSPRPYCRRFSKQDGFITWDEFKRSRESVAFDRKIRALFPWPGVWTKMPNGKILKLLPNNLLQFEGKQPITFQQFKAGYKQLL
jgi:methionyl-tRNA formyltransferase